MSEMLFHVTIGGGYSNTPKVEVETVRLADNFYSTTIYNHGTNGLKCKHADTPEQAERDFMEARSRCLQPLQAAAFSAGMVEGGKYTILHYTEFGPLVAQKFRFHSMEPCTYAQYGDAVRITCTPFRRRGKYIWTLYNKSFAIYDGWQDLPEAATMETLKETPEVKVSKWKYTCWDANGFTACKGILKNCLVI